MADISITSPKRARAAFSCNSNNRFRLEELNAEKNKRRK
jgi:hypothetical protein